MSHYPKGPSTYYLGFIIGFLAKGLLKGFYKGYIGIEG